MKVVTIQELIDTLSEFEDKDQAVLAELWYAEDIRAAPFGDNLSDAQVLTVMQRLAHSFDADIRLSRESIESEVIDTFWFS